jgi:hypothetical protein
MIVPRSRSESAAGGESLAGDKRLVDCPESTIGLSLPSPLSERLDQLVRLAEDAGERTTRKEIVASLILCAPTDGPALSERIRQLRAAVVHEAIAPDESGLVRLARHGPGPRSRQR